MADSDYAPDNGAEPGLIARTTNAFTSSFRALVSKQAQKAYLGTALFIAASLLMVCVSSVAYGIFYYKFIPQIGFERIVHLQFGDGHPWGTASVRTDLVSLQPYDVTVKLELPRTPSNLAAGNFMLDLALFSRHSTSTRTGTNTNTAATTATDNAISHSRRPAILTYTSPMIDTASKLSFMPLYVVGWHGEKEVVEVPMMEEIEFPRGWRNLPQSLRLEIQSDERMQVYGVQVQFRARLNGLRWFMYTWRVSSFLIFSFAFWCVSMLSMGVAWLGLALAGNNGNGNGNVKSESRTGTPAKESDGDESDVSSQDDQPGPSNDPFQREIKEESEGGLSDLPVSEVGGSHVGSGAGTGLESPEARGIQRRRSQGVEGEG